MPSALVSPALRRALRSPALLAWCVFLAAQPFYVLPTGLPQPGDILLLPLAALALLGWNGRLSKDAVRTLKALLRFTVWVAIVAYTWVLLLNNFVVVGRDGMMLFPLYYVFNAIVVLVAMILYQRFGDEFLRLTFYVVLGVIVMLVLSSFVFANATLRSSLFFANPNQLGYHALLSGCVLALTQRRLRINVIVASAALTGCAYLAVLSASRSAVAGIAILLVLLVFSNLRVILVASLVALVLVQFGGGPLEHGIDASQQRVFEHRQANLSFFEQRGYDRIVNNKQYLLFGAGEGATTRFADSTAIGAAEIHSSAGTLIFCYGIVGVVLFGFFVWRLLRGAGLHMGLMLVPPLIYTFAHQGLRFTMLWIVVGVFIAVKGSDRRSRAPVLVSGPLGTVP